MLNVYQAQRSRIIYITEIGAQMNSKSIMFIGSHLDVGGAGKMLKYVVNVCSECFDSVILLTYCQNERPRDIFSSVLFEHTDIPKRITLASRLRVMREIRRKVRYYHPDIVCAFVSEVAVMSRFASIGLGTKFVSAERGDPYSLPLKWKLLTRITYGTSFSCFFQLDKARDFYGPSVCEKSYVIPNPFILPYDVEPYYGIRDKTIVSAGRFDPEKRFELLIEAFAAVYLKHPEYKLVIYGAGPLLEKYKHLAQQLKISDVVSFPGYSSNVAESVRKDGIFVLSSRYEGIPNALIEAMSIGIPSVSTDCSPGGPAFLAGNGERGIIVPLEDISEMIKAINMLIEDEALYHRIEKNAPQIRKLLAPEIIKARWIAAFNDIVERKR